MWMPFFRKEADYEENREAFCLSDEYGTDYEFRVRQDIPKRNDYFS